MSNATDIWDEDLPSSPEEEYEDLLRALRRSHGFGLLFVECSPDGGDQLVRRLRRDLHEGMGLLNPLLRIFGHRLAHQSSSTVKTIDVLSFEEPLQDGNVYKRVKRKLTENPVDILFIQGLEHSLYDYEDAKRQLGWSSQETYGYSWKGVPPIMVNLNQQRENFRDSFNTCLVFLVPSFVIKYLIHCAPDFFDWRSGIFRFSMAKTQLQRSVRLAYTEERNTEGLKSSVPHEHRRKILHIQSLVDEEGLTAAEKADLHFEQAFLFGTVGELEAAIASYDKALRLKPDNARAYFNKACCYALWGKVDEAIESLQRAIALDPECREDAKTDSDFDSIRDNERFRALVEDGGNR